MFNNKNKTCTYIRSRILQQKACMKCTVHLHVYVWAGVYYIPKLNYNYSHN